jgi:hypothetical protein
MIMQNQLFHFLSVLSLTICATLTSCKKEVPTSLGVEKTLATTVTKWLESQKSVRQPSKAENIEQLKGNLDFSKASIEPFTDGDQLIVIPIKETFRDVKLPGSRSILNLVLINDRQNIIKNGRIAIYIPAAGEKLNKVPRNTFSRILTAETISCNGIFNFLSVSGTLLHKYEYKDGRLSSFGEVSNQAHGNSQNISEKSVNGNCTDWYIVTTYYSNGVLLYQESQYIGTTCEGCDDQNYQSICPDTGTGSDGGSGGVNTDEITTDDISLTSEESDEADAVGGAAPKIRYQYNAQIVRNNGFVSSVSVFPTIIANAHEAYIDRYGRNTTRIVTLYGHANSWTSLGTTAMIYWSCFAYGRWIYTDGSPEYNRTWSNNHTAIR